MNYPMSVFDDEAGPLADGDELEECLTLIAAGLTLEEYRAFMALIAGRKPN